VRGDDGVWHLIGITHAEPANPLDERFFAHATAPDLFGPWSKQAPALHAEPAVGENHVWAPHVVRRAGRWWMAYCAGGSSHAAYRIHMAASDDLWRWERVGANPLVVDGFDARDPMLLELGGRWAMYYTATEAPDGGRHVVKAVFSDDFERWTDERIVFRHDEAGTYGGPTESPFVVARAGGFYLFLCTNAPYNQTAVYRSDDPIAWDLAADLVGTFPAHAAEVIEAGDGRTFVSGCGWGQGGVYLAELSWRGAQV